MRRILVAAPAAAALVAGLLAGTPTPAEAAKDKVTWTSTSIVAGTGGQVAATGDLAGKGKRKLKLQVKIKGGWRTFGKARTDRKGVFSIAAPLDWYGAHKVRIRGKGVSKKTTVTVAPPYTPRGNPAGYVYIPGDTKKLKKARRFNPCETLTYAVNSSRVGDTALPMTQQAMAQLSAATGITMKYVGPTDVIPHSVYPKSVPNPKGVDLVIAWGSFTDVPAFKPEGPLGFGGANKLVRSRDARGKKVLEAKTAAVTINSDVYGGTYPPVFDSPGINMPQILLHELAHAMGLDHVEGAPDELMSVDNFTRWPDGNMKALYGLGDLAGLASVGLGSGCLR